MTNYLQVKTALLNAPMSVEQILAARRLEERYCLQEAQCLVGDLGLSVDSGDLCCAE